VLSEDNSGDDSDNSWLRSVEGYDGTSSGGIPLNVRNLSYPELQQFVEILPRGLEASDWPDLSIFDG
jgi:hypothetical protein